MLIPRGSRARLIAVPSNDGKDTNLDLRSVTVNGTPYQIDAAGSGSGTPGGLGANKRTGMYVGGGAGAGTQVITGKKQDLPAETQLSYKLATNAQLTPLRNNSQGTSNPQK